MMARDFDRQLAKLQMRTAILKSFCPAGHAYVGGHAINPLRIGDITRSVYLCNKATGKSPSIAALSTSS
jgi:hypothetical protein